MRQNMQQKSNPLFEMFEITHWQRRDVIATSVFFQAPSKRKECAGLQSSLTEKNLGDNPFTDPSTCFYQQSDPVFPEKNLAQNQ